MYEGVNLILELGVENLSVKAKNHYRRFLNMKNKLLDKNYVLSNGIDYDELEVDYDRFGDKEFIVRGEKVCFFSWLTYLLYPNGNIKFYAFFENGFKNGDFVEFYDDGKIKFMMMEK